jgi:methyl-accepting chemotaxis protein
MSPSGAELHIIDAFHANHSGILADRSIPNGNEHADRPAVAEEINRNIHVISKSVDDTATEADHLAQASERLATLAGEIQQTIGSFRT